MALTEVAIKRAKPAAKGYRLTDGGGLHLFIAPGGAKAWRYRYRLAKKEQLLSLGRWPEVSLQAARDLRSVARKAVQEGMDPQRAIAGGARAGERDFEAIAREWVEIQRPTWSTRHAADVLGSLEDGVFPKIGHLPPRSIKPPVVLDLLRAIEERPAIETAKRVRQRVSAVFVYAIASGEAETDPAALVGGALKPLKKGRQPAVKTLEEARQVLRDIEAVPGHPITKLALRLLALTVVRPGTLATTPWAEYQTLAAIDPVWWIPAQRMKLKTRLKDDEAFDHPVPLAQQAVETIKVLRGLSGRRPYVFPNVRRTMVPMSENAMGYMLNRAGYSGRHVPHGWRATFSTIMNELYPADRHIIDLMLAHVPKDKVEGAYNRARHLERRRDLAQAWADMLLEGAPPAADLLDGARR